jgi:hypothetical protein
MDGAREPRAQQSACSRERGTTERVVERWVGSRDRCRSVRFFHCSSDARPALLKKKRRGKGKRKRKRKMKKMREREKLIVKIVIEI